MKLITLFIFFSIVGSCQVKDTVKLNDILNSISFSEFPYLAKLSEDLIDILPREKIDTLELLRKDRLAEDTLAAWRDGLSDALNDLFKNTPHIYGYGLQTRKFIDSTFTQSLSVDKIKAFIYRKEFGVTVFAKYGSRAPLNQRVYIQAYNKLTYVVMEKYYGLNIEKYADSNIKEYIRKNNSEHDKWDADGIKP